ncbi:MAG: glycosyltransferase [Candidatus Kaiserbacteria bacterium]|nr:MAG: glycosyltransferase [Candidatus Kaiserbacteria bacterium]
MLAAVFLAVFAATVALPGPLTVVLLANTVVGIFLSALQVYVALLPRFTARHRKPRKEPFISILVPAHNEPPAVLMQTLESLSKLSYGEYEVLVIDNNTSDPQVWKPVERFTLSLGRRFRFLHVENLTGFKAGALNYALARTSAQSKYVAVIDADYVVNPDFLSLAVSYFTHREIALVQFPQEYRNATSENRPVADEYRHFFRIYMNMANHLDCVPSTGTVSIYSNDALRSIGGFRVQALTEDADAGLRLYRAGFRGVYIDRPIGSGLMPYDIESYRKQKWRWALGNAQALSVLFTSFKRMPFRSWIGFLSHLTAWDHLNFLPFAVLAGYALVVTPAILTTGEHKMLLNVASFSIFLTIGSKFVLFLVTLRTEENPIRRALRALLIHMGLTLVYSEALMRIMFRQKSDFERTNKFILVKAPQLLKSTYKELILGLWFLMGAVGGAYFGSRVVTITVFSISAAALLSVYYVHWKVRPTKEISKRLFAHIERKYDEFLRSPTIPAHITARGRG